jgi:crotonobetainyl-CoA hydratase
MTGKSIEIRIDGTAMLVTINRPDVANALDAAAHADLAAIFDDYAAADDLRVAVITGTGDRFFCAGSDLKAREKTGGDVMPKTGFAGLEIVLACDLAIAVGSAKFGLPEPKVGLAATGGLHRLARQVPMKQAMQIALTGRTFDAREALRFGLINQIVEPGELADTVSDLIAQLNECAPLALQATKQMMLNGLNEASLSAAFGAHYPALERMLQSDDAREGTRAFIEKRKPDWRGC